MDIGYVQEAGSFSFDESSSTYSVTTGGTSIGAWEDWFYFVYEEASGDLDIRARVQYISQGWASAGIMIRDKLFTGSKFAGSIITLNDGGRFTVRKEEYTPYPVVSVPTLMEGSWLRLVKEGSTISNYVSEDGETWTLVGSETIEFGETFYIGIAGLTESSVLTTDILVEDFSVEFN